MENPKKPYFNNFLYDKIRKFLGTENLNYLRELKKWRVNNYYTKIYR